MQTVDVDIGAVQQLFYKATGSDEGPSDYDLLRIREYAFTREGRGQLQRMLERRLKSPDRYSIQEVFNILIMICDMLKEPHPEFFRFCCRQAQHVLVLETYVPATLQALQAMASKISSILNNHGDAAMETATIEQNTLQSESHNDSNFLSPPISSPYTWRSGDVENAD